MNNNNMLSGSELTYFVIGVLIGFSIFQLPNDVVKEVWQDGWISTLIGSIYPLYIIIISSYIIKKFPNDNIFSVSNKYLGNVLGGILNFTYVFQYVIFISATASGFTNILITYVVGFMSKITIIFVILITTIYGANSKLKDLSRMNKLNFYIILILSLILIGAIKEGSLLNITPVMQSSIIDVIKASRHTIFAYSGIESILIIYPYVKNKNSIKKDSLKGLAIVVAIYVWIVFISIYYLTPDIVAKSLWPLSLVTESIRIPVINNFRFIFIFLWTIVLIKIISNYYHIAILGFSNITRINKKKVCMFISPFIILLSVIYKNEIVRRRLIELVLPYTTIFNLVYITLIAIITYIKKVNKK